MKKTIEKNTMSYMALQYGPYWYAGINENFSGNEPFDAINAEFENDDDWQEASNSNDYWGGQIELYGRFFWIASGYEVTINEGICFLVEVKKGE